MNAEKELETMILLFSLFPHFHDAAESTNKYSFLESLKHVFNFYDVMKLQFLHPQLTEIFLEIITNTLV